MRTRHVETTYCAVDCRSGSVFVIHITCICSVFIPSVRQIVSLISLFPLRFRELIPTSANWFASVRDPARQEITAIQPTLEEQLKERMSRVNWLLLLGAWKVPKHAKRPM